MSRHLYGAANSRLEFVKNFAQPLFRKKLGKFSDRQPTTEKAGRLQVGPRGKRRSLFWFVKVGSSYSQALFRGAAGAFVAGGHRLVVSLILLVGLSIMMDGIYLFLYNA